MESLVHGEKDSITLNTASYARDCFQSNFILTGETETYWSGGQRNSIVRCFEKGQKVMQ